MTVNGHRLHWILRDADTLELEPPVQGGSWLIGWPSLPLNPSPKGPERIVTWSLYTYLAFSVAREASVGEDAAARVLAGLALYREKLARGLTKLYPVRGHRLWVRSARCPEGGLVPLVRSPRVRVPGGRIYGVIVDYDSDGEPRVELEPGGAGSVTVEGGKVRCPGGALSPLNSVSLEGRILVAIVDEGGIKKPDNEELRAASTASTIYRRASPLLESLGLLPGRPRGTLSWLAKRGVQGLHEAYPERAAVAVAYSLKTVRSTGETLAALIYAAAASPWTRYSSDGFTLTLQRVRPDVDVHWEVDPLSWEGLLGAVETVASLAILWSTTSRGPREVSYAAPWEPEAAVDQLAVLPPKPGGLERILLAENISLHWAPPSLQLPPADYDPAADILAIKAAKIAIGGPPGSEALASTLKKVLGAGFKPKTVEAVVAYGPPASWVVASMTPEEPGVLDADLILRAVEVGRESAAREARRGPPGRALDRGVSEALNVLTERWPLRRPDGSRVAVKTLMSISLAGALEGIAEAYVGNPLDGPSRFYLALRLLGPLPKSDAEMLADSVGERLSRLSGLVIVEKSGVVRAKPLNELESGKTVVGELAEAVNGGPVPSEACRFAKALAGAPVDGDEKLIARILARCRGVAMERWIPGSTPS